MTSFKHRITTIVKTGAVLTTLAFSSHALAVDPYVENMLIGFCKASMRNDVLALHRSIRSHRMDYVTVADKVVCNSQPIMNFAMQYGAVDTYRSFERRLPSTLRKRIEIRDMSSISESDDVWAVTFDVANDVAK
ncbi:DUF3718 domain-containing protein [Alteromonas halophila]|uniref:DUF3718 domain-containing protein n=1 Tax=Alteromonas halophila TaxID=516698 RepID=A0A918MVE4_9ALTE|nr:DUF3718 domain-containing protein [Alteromonas halophila]GGW76458.1 hypothetical protein GCM10007391_06370 [Alteromonas halophila]